MPVICLTWCHDCACTAQRTYRCAQAHARIHTRARAHTGAFAPRVNTPPGMPSPFLFPYLFCVSNCVHIPGNNHTHHVSHMPTHVCVSPEAIKYAEMRPSSPNTRHARQMKQESARVRDSFAGMSSLGVFQPLAQELGAGRRQTASAISL